MTTLPNLEPAGLEAAIKDFQERTGGFGDEDDRIEVAAIIRAYLSAACSVPEAGKAVEDARQLPAVEVMSADTLPSGDEYLISKAFVHEGAIIALYGTNDKLIGWIDTNAWMKGRVYRDQILPLASSLAPTGAEPVAPTGEIAGLIDSLKWSSIGSSKFKRMSLDRDGIDRVIAALTSLSTRLAEAEQQRDAAIAQLQKTGDVARHLRRKLEEAERKLEEGAAHE